MKIKMLSFFCYFTFLACTTVTDVSIVGTWLVIPDGDYGRLLSTDQMTFTADGIYEYTSKTSDGSIINTVDGTYKFDKVSNSIEVTVDDVTLRSYIISSDSNYIKLQTEDGINWQLQKN